MTTRRLVLQWIVGLAAAGVCAWLLTPSGEGRFDAIDASLASPQVAALRRDSVAAVQAARVAASAREDSVLAVVYTPPEPWRDPVRERGKRDVALFSLMALIAVMLVSSTVRWWDRHRRAAS